MKIIIVYRDALGDVCNVFISHLFANFVAETLK